MKEIHMAYQLTRSHVLLCAISLFVCVSCSEAPGGGSIGGSGKLEPTRNSVFVIGSVESVDELVIDGQHFTAVGTDILVNGDSGHLTDLRIGMSVSANVDYQNDNATRIEYQSIVAGPIDSVASLDNSLQVLGQQVTISEDTFLDNLTVEDLFEGEVIEVSGERSSDGIVVADYVRSRNVDDVFLVVGDIDNFISIDAPVTISGTPVDMTSYFKTADKETIRQLKNGAKIKAELQRRDTQLVVLDVVVISNIAIEQYESVVVNGVVDSITENRAIVVNNFVFQTNSETEYINREGNSVDPALVVESSKVRITGLTLSGSDIVASKVELKTRRR